MARELALLLRQATEPAEHVRRRQRGGEARQLRARALVGREDAERRGQHRLPHLAREGAEQLDDLRRQRLAPGAVGAREPGRNRGGEGVRRRDAEPGALAAASGVASRRLSLAPAASAPGCSAPRPRTPEPASPGPARARSPPDRAAADCSAPAWPAPRSTAGAGTTPGAGSAWTRATRPRAAAEERGDGLRRVPLARYRRPAPAEDRLPGQQCLDEPVPKGAIVPGGLLQV